MSTRSARAPRLTCEALEDRSNPDGNVAVAVSDGTIFVTGDSLNNGVMIEHNAFGDLFVHGNSNTAINGLSSVYLGRGVPLGVAVNLNGGADNLGVFGLNVVGNIEILAASGNDAVTVLGTRAGGATVVNVTDGDDVAWLSDVVSGVIVLEGGTGFDRTHVDNATALGLIADLGDGSDNTEIFGVNVAGHVEVMAGAGDDATVVLGTTAGGGVVVNGASGDDVTWLSGVGASFIVLEGTTGFDRVHADNVLAPQGVFFFNDEQAI